VNCLAPGGSKTQQNQVLYENQEWVDYLVDRIPMKRPGQPHDLDGAVVFLASEASGYVTGTDAARGRRHLDRFYASHRGAEATYLKSPRRSLRTVLRLRNWPNLSQ